MPFKCSRTIGAASMTYTRHQWLRSQALKLHFNSVAVAAQGSTPEGLCMHRAGQGASAAQAQPSGAPSGLDPLKPSCPNSGKGKLESLSGYSRAGTPSTSQGLQRDSPSSEAHKHLHLWKFHILKLTGAQSG